MTRGVLVVAFALVLTAGAMGAAVGITLADPSAPENVTPTASPMENEPERLAVPAPTATGYSTAPADPTAASSMEFQQLAASYEANRIQEHVAREPHPREKINLTAQAVERLATDLDDLYAAEQAAYEAYAAGEIDESTFGLQLARLHASAVAIDHQGEGIRRAISNIEAHGRQSELNILRGQLRRTHMEVRAFQGPVGEQLTTHVTGEIRAETTFWYAGSETGYELSAQRGNAYARQSYISTNRDREGGAIFTNTADGEALLWKQYPWLEANRLAESSDLSGSLFWSIVEHPAGVSKIHLDADTELPFRETVELHVPTIETYQAANTTVDTIAVTVDATFPGGPAAVSVRDEVTGEPIADAVIHIDGVAIGETRGDGTAEYIAPSGSYVLVVEVGAAQIELSVDGGTSSSHD